MAELQEILIANLTLDTYRKNNIHPLVVPKGDYGARVVRVMITEQEKAVTVKEHDAVYIVAERSGDGASEAFSGKVNKDGSVTVPITQWMLDIPVYDVICHVVVTGDGYQYSTNSFLIEPQSKENPTELSEDDPRKNVVDELLAKDSAIQADLENVKQRTTSVEQRAVNLEKRVTNLEQGMMSDTFETDDSVAYIKDVPTDALPYAAISKIGGMTRREGNVLRSAPVTEVKSVGTNLIPYPYANESKVTYGVTYTVQEDGGIRIKGTCTQGTSMTIWHHNANLFTAYWRADLNGAAKVIGECCVRLLGTCATGTSSRVLMEFEANANGGHVFIWVYAGETYDCVVYPMINKGATALPYARFREPQTLHIPSAVQDLDGYGQSDPNNESLYNYVDFESRKFIAYGHIVSGSWVAFASVQKTDISDLITADNFIEVDGGGTIELVNANSKAVPSEIIYQVKGE